MGGPLSGLDIAPVTLDPAKLPGYALLSTLRMFAAIFASLIFAVGVGTLAAKSRAGHSRTARHRPSPVLPCLKKPQCH